MPFYRHPINYLMTRASVSFCTSYNSNNNNNNNNDDDDDDDNNRSNNRYNGRCTIGFFRNSRIWRAYCRDLRIIEMKSGNLSLEFSDSRTPWFQKYQDSTDPTIRARGASDISYTIDTRDSSGTRAGRSIGDTWDTKDTKDAGNTIY